MPNVVFVGNMKPSNIHKIIAQLCWIDIKWRHDSVLHYVYSTLKGMEHVPNMFMSFDRYLFLEVNTSSFRLVYVDVELLSQIVIVNACMHFTNLSEVSSLIIEILNILKHLSVKL